MFDSSIRAIEIVASSNIQISKYTDYHHVDEDMMTSIRLGGSWTYEIISGIMLRDVADLPTTTFEFVASSNIQISKYTDWHNVDEDTTTITYQSGYCYDGTRAGVMRRSADYNRNDTFVDIASVKNKTSSPSTDC